MGARRAGGHAKKPGPASRMTDGKPLSGDHAIGLQGGQPGIVGGAGLADPDSATTDMRSSCRSCAGAAARAVRAQRILSVAGDTIRG